MATNVVVLDGRLTRDPELRATNSGKSVCSFTIANDKRGKDAGTNFIECVAWEGRGETISKYFSKGSRICVTGRIDFQQWEVEGGQKRSKLIIIVDDFSFVDSKKSSEPRQESSEFGGEEIDLSDIPF